MPTHVALLRAVNVGGTGKLAMADLRRLVTSLGHRDVATYIQSGNLVFTPRPADLTARLAHSGLPAQAATAATAALAAQLEEAIAAEFGLRAPAIVLTRDELAAAIDANPYGAEPNPRYVHGIFLAKDQDEATDHAIRTAVSRAADKGSRDEARLTGRVLYLHTPGGFGTSLLVKELLAKRSGPLAAGTARNWATITKLLALCDG